MKRIILLTIILIFLTGCGLFNLSDFTVPDDLEFIAIIGGLDTPKKICQYMESFEWNISINTYNPYQTYLANLEDWDDTGDCDDFAAFAVWVADYHGYETYRIKLYVNFTGFVIPITLPHVLGVFVEGGSYTYSCNESYCPVFVHNFKDIVEHYVANERLVTEWFKYKVYGYNMDVVKIGYN